VKIKKILLFVVICMMLTICCCPLNVAAEDLVAEMDTEMNLDVVFAIDISQSMTESDEKKIALDAFNLLVDECDETCGIGYVMFTQKIKNEKVKSIVNIDTASNVAALKNGIAAVRKSGYDVTGNTYIALGLSKAKELLDESKKADPNRHRAIILLSDGNTFLNKKNGDPKTTEEAKEELNQVTVPELKKAGYPVYAIGLNADGSLDKKEMEEIAAKTGGMAFFPNSAKDIPEIVASITAEYLHTKDTTEVLNDGKISFKVENESVYAVYILLNTSKTREEMNPRLISPSNHQVALDGNNIKVTSTASYTLIKLFSPDKGTWMLELNGVTNNNCHILSRTIYSMYLKQLVDPAYVTGQNVKISVSLNGRDGIINDKDFINTVSVSSNISGAENKNIALTNKGNGVFEGEFLINSEGRYNIVSEAKTKDGKFTRVSDEFSFDSVDPISNDRITIEQTLSSNEIRRGETVTVSTKAKNIESNENISMADSIFTAFLTDKDGNAVSDIVLKKNDKNIYEGQFTVDQKGSYTVITKVSNSKNMNKSSNKSVFTVTRTEMSLKGSAEITLGLNSKPMNTSQKIAVKDYVECDEDDILSVTFEPSASELYDVEEKQENNDLILELSGNRAGTGSSVLKIKNQYNEQIAIVLSVNVNDSLKWIIIILSVAAAVIAAGVIVCLLIHPKLNGSVYISMIFPATSSIPQIPETRLNLPRKIKTNARDIFKYNPAAAKTFETAFSRQDIYNDLKKITIQKKFNGDLLIRFGSTRSSRNINATINDVSVKVRINR